jgi:DNA-binding MarR family transcriptional regulator
MRPTAATTSPTTDAPVDPVDLADAFFTVSHALKRAINARVQPTGLSLARLRVLYQLDASPGIRIGELSTCVDVAPRTMTSTVEAMERDGLVTRRPDPNDGRATIVTITDAGRRSFAEGRRVQASVIADLFASLDADQREALGEVLVRLQELATADALPAP